MYVRHEIERKSHFCLYNVALRHKGEHKSLVSKKFFNSQVGTNVVRISIHLWFLRFLFDSSFFRNIFVLFSIFFNYYYFCLLASFYILISYCWFFSSYWLFGIWMSSQKYFDELTGLKKRAQMAVEKVGPHSTVSLAIQLITTCISDLSYWQRLR